MNYVDDKATRAFLKAEVAKRDPVLKDKSGQWYWLNDWRKSHVGENGKITYRDLIDRLYELMTARGRLPRIPSAEFNGFIADWPIPTTPTPLGGKPLTHGKHVRQRLSETTITSIKTIKKSMKMAKFNR